MSIKKVTEHIKKEMASVIIGQEDVIEQIIIAFLCEGHVILEGAPGLAKTLMAKTFAAIIGKNFRRIQFTPDLMPQDIIGTMVFNLQESRFHFNRGPVFTNILLADEINRTSPKTQAALLEVMQERQVSVEGEAIILDTPFMVLATQNPIEYEGTYPLPEAQLDRFLMKITLDYPDRDTELAVLQKFRDGFDSNKLEGITFSRLTDTAVKTARNEFQKIRVDDIVLNYILSIIATTRNDSSILVGASTRAAIHILNAARYCAGIEERNYVIADDVKRILLPVLRHRIILQADAEIEGNKNDDVLTRIIEAEEVPR
ncbi:MAG: MoxR family ATPase [Spirochaetales bacterium]|nr:MoxR family ATPase [Spirochaetales bacterium]